MQLHLQFQERLMMNLSFKSILVSLLSCFSVASATWAGETVPVFVSIVPQKFFVEQIGRDRVDVHIMVEPGANPATYEPKPSQMAAIAEAEIYFSIGVPFERAWMKKIRSSNPDMVVVETDHGIRKLPMASHHHDKGENHEKSLRSQGAPDPHIWLSPPLVMIQARTILCALQKADPAHHAFYESNYRDFASMLAELDGNLRSVFADLSRVEFMVFHPAWGYFAEAYGLRQVPIEIEGKNPKPARLRTLIEHAKKHDIEVIFVQPQFSSRSAEQIAGEIGARVVFVDPLALDWAENLRQVASRFKTGIE
jgi:zinc transport system substrate-binding protein